MPVKKNILVIVLLAILLLISGLARDYIFTNINNQLPIRNDSTLTHTSDVNQNLILLKWPLTIFFTLWYGLLSYLLIRTLFQNKSFSLLTLASYFLLSMLSFSIYALGMLSSHPEIFFRLSRNMMGLVQSPLLLMLLIPAFFMRRKEQ